MQDVGDEIIHCSERLACRAEGMAAALERDTQDHMGCCH